MKKRKPLKPFKKKQARAMRRNGEKMSVIIKTLQIAPSTAWLWVKDIELTYEQKEKAGLISKGLNKWKCTPIPTTCDQCGQTFDWMEGPADYARKKHYFCSRQCYWAFNRTLKGQEHEPRFKMLKSAITRAKKRNIPFNITLEDIPSIPEQCPVLGIPLQFGKGYGTNNSPSLDRIIPALGYVKGNIRIISKRANSIKSNASAAEVMLVANDLARLELERDTQLNHTNNDIVDVEYHAPYEVWSKCPSRAELERLIWLMPTTKIGEKFGVADVTVGIWCQKLNITRPPLGYWHKKL